MNPAIKIKLDEIKSLLDAEVTRGADAVIQFAREYATDTKQKHKALILKSNLLSTKNESIHQIVKQDLLELCDDIFKNITENSQTIFEEKKKKRSSLIQYFKEKEVIHETVFEGKNVGKTFKKSDFHLTKINLILRLGEITGIVGENGNGKTTLCRIVAGNLSHTEGELSFPFHKNKNPKLIDWMAVKHQIGYLHQELHPCVGTVRENLHFEATLHGIYGEENKQQVNYIIHRLDLSNFENSTWNQLSGGYKLRLALAKLLVWRPKLLILDEPLANLDINAQLNLMSDLKDIASSFKYPLSILITSQHLHEVERISDYILHLRDGREVFYGKTNEIGVERLVNTFEFECTKNQKELEKEFRGFNYNSLNYNGLNYVITTPLEISNKEILSQFISKDIDIEYFRNISNSTKTEMIKIK